MKDPRLLIPVRCTTRKIFRSTGTKEVAAAKRIASQIIESFWNDAGRGAERLKLRNDNATIRELIQRYERNAVQWPRTIRGNVRALRLIVKNVHNGDPDQKPTTVLTSGLIRDFEKRRLQRAEKRATAATCAGVIQRTRKSTASFVRQARSIVALRKMKFYEDLKLPDLAAFRGESVETPHRSLPRPFEGVECDGSGGAEARVRRSRGLCGTPSFFAARLAEYRNR